MQMIYMLDLERKNTTIEFLNTLYSRPADTQYN